jgi:hypothetical protein
MVYEVETNRLIPLYTPLFFGWTISLNCADIKYSSAFHMLRSIAWLNYKHKKTYIYTLYIFCVGVQPADSDPTGLHQHSAAAGRTGNICAPCPMSWNKNSKEGQTVLLSLKLASPPPLVPPPSSFSYNSDNTCFSQSFFSCGK